MSEAHLYMGRVVSTENGSPASQSYWFTEVGASKLAADIGFSGGAARLSKVVGGATLDINCQDCDKPAFVTSRSAANDIISFCERRWRKEPYRCDKCAEAHKLQKMRNEWNARKEKARRENELRWMPYREYLGTSDWAVRRRSVIDRAGFRCQICASDGKLHVHHRTYARRGAERAEDMVALCADCHGLFHEHGKLAEGGRAA